MTGPSRTRDHAGHRLGMGLVRDREYPRRTAPPGTAQDRRFRSTRLDIRCAAPEGIMVITDTVAPDPGGGRNYRLAVSLVSSPQTPDIVAGIRPDAGPAVVPVLRPPGCRDPQPDGVMTPSLAGQPGHGRTAFVRRQPARIVNGRPGRVSQAHRGISPPGWDRTGSLGCPLPGPYRAGHVADVPLVTTGPVVHPGSVSPVLAGAFLRRRSQQVNDRPGAADGTLGCCPRSCR